MLGPVVAAEGERTVLSGRTDSAEPSAADDTFL